MQSTPCNRAIFIGIAVDSLKAHRRAWGQYLACESSPYSARREKIRERALKHAIVALTFSCNYIDAALAHHCRAKLGHNFSETMIYETRLQVLGFNDAQLLIDVKKIRIALRELEREKVLELHIKPNKLHAKQNEAEKSVATAIRIRKLLQD
ncbi:hypothetical protein [Lelliottia amnigena]|uniref:hypothetical protein n=1 Tax=Lelliottia amnigena TaxID=61646 RepID=UPI0040569CEE